MAYRVSRRYLFGKSIFSSNSSVSRLPIFLALSWSFALRIADPLHSFRVYQISHIQCEKCWVSIDDEKGGSVRGVGGWRSQSKGESMKWMESYMNPMRCPFALRIATVIGPPQKVLQFLVIALSYLSLWTASSMSFLRGSQPTWSEGWAVVSTVFHILPEAFGPTLVPQPKYRV
jgi:hypothetical protein